MAQRSPHSQNQFGASSVSSGSGSGRGSTVGHNPYLAGLDPAALAREAANDAASTHPDNNGRDDRDARANALNSSSNELAGGGAGGGSGSYDANAYLDRLGMSLDGKAGGNYASSSPPGKHGGRSQSMFSSEVSF